MFFHMEYSYFLLLLAFKIKHLIGGNFNGQSDAYVQVILFLELPVRAIPNAPRERL